MNVGRMGADWVIGADMLCGCVVVVRCGVLIRALVLTLVDSEALPKRQDRVPTPVGARQRPVRDGVELARVHLHAVRADDVAEEFDFGLVEIALLHVSEEAGRAKPL